MQRTRAAHIEHAGSLLSVELSLRCSGLSNQVYFNLTDMEPPAAIPRAAGGYFITLPR
jgi:hypothetical protein